MHRAIIGSILLLGLAGCVQSRSVPAQPHSDFGHGIDEFNDMVNETIHKIHQQMREDQEHPKVWMKPGSQAGEFETQRYECLKEAARYPTDITGSVTPNYHIAVLCMQAHGWHLVPKIM